MDSTYIMPFINAVRTVFETILQVKIEVSQPHSIETAPADHEVRGVIALSGEVSGTIVISFPTDSAQAVVTKLLGNEVETNTKAFQEAMSQLIEQVASSATAELADKDLQLAPASVLIGAHTESADAIQIVVPCRAETGGFSILVTIERCSGTGAARAA